VNVKVSNLPQVEIWYVQGIHRLKGLQPLIGLRTPLD